MRSVAIIALPLLAACSRTGLRVPASPRDASRDGSTDVALTGSCDDPHDDTLLPPRPIAPMSTSFVTSHRPTLRWELAAGVDGVCLDLCRDRACTDRIASRTVLGETFRPDAALAPDVVFWRLRSHRPGDAGSLPSPTWQFTVGAENAPVDTAWGSRMDLDGDGLGDLVVNATEYGGRAGRLYVFAGARPNVSPSPSWTIEAPDGPQSAFGTTFGSVGDIDGDGFGDLVVGAWQVDGAIGRAYVFFGGDTPGSRFVTLAPNASESGFGIAADGLGDIDGDGYGDLAIGIDPGQEDPGEIAIYRGGAATDALVRGQTLRGDGDSFEGFASAHAAGDLDGDRLADVLVPASNFNPDRGRVYVFRGTSGGLVRDRVIMMRGPLRGYFGDGAAAGDVNGDGFADLLAGASGTSLYSGYVDVYIGSASGLSTAPIVTLGDNGIAYGFLTGDLGGIGDLNGDGFDEIAVGSLGGGMLRGGVSVFYGSSEGPHGPGVEQVPRGETPPLTPFEYVGHTFSRPNDLDRDGRCDLAVGIASTGGAGGRVLVFDSMLNGRIFPVAAVANPTGVADGFASMVR